MPPHFSQLDRMSRVLRLLKYTFVFERPHCDLWVLNILFQNVPPLRSYRGNVILGQEVDLSRMPVFPCSLAEKVLNTEQKENAIKSTSEQP